MKDADNFVVGIPNCKNVPPLEVDLPKTIKYLKETGKKFEELTSKEIKLLKPSE